MKHGTLVLLALLGGIVFVETLERADLKNEPPAPASAAPQEVAVPAAAAVTMPVMPKVPATPATTLPPELTEMEALTLNGHTHTTLADAGQRVDG